jgi:hypothetical protein
MTVSAVPVHGLLSFQNAHKNPYKYLGVAVDDLFTLDEE